VYAKGYYDGGESQGTGLFLDYVGSSFQFIGPVPVYETSVLELKQGDIGRGYRTRINMKNMICNLYSY